MPFIQATVFSILLLFFINQLKAQKPLRCSKENNLNHTTSYQQTGQIGRNAIVDSYGNFLAGCMFNCGCHPSLTTHMGDFSCLNPVNQPIRSSPLLSTISVPSTHESTGFACSDTCMIVICAETGVNVAGPCIPGLKSLNEPCSQACSVTLWTFLVLVAMR
eukprot:UN05316